MIVIFDIARALGLSSRTARILWNVLQVFIGRVVNIASTLVFVPIAVLSVGKDAYGYLAICVSFAGFFSYADFGLGAAAVNALAESESNQNHRVSVKIVKQVWTFLLIVCGLTLCLIALAYAVGCVIGLKHEETEFWHLSLIVACSAALGIPFSVAQRVLYALQHNGIAQAWLSLGKVATVVGALATWLMHGGLLSLAASLLVLPVLSSIGCFVHLFYFLRPDLRPSLTKDFSGLKEIIYTGVHFTFLQLSNFAESSLDPLVLGWRFGAATVAIFDVMTRIYNYVPSLNSIMVSPIWPAVRNALSSGDHRWVSKANFASKWIVIASALIFSISISLELDLIMTKWAHIAANVPLSMRISLTMYVVVYCYYYNQCMFLVALDKVRIQSAIAIGFCFGAIFLKIAFAHLGMAAMININLGLNIVRCSIQEYVLRAAVAASMNPVRLQVTPLSAETTSNVCISR